MSFRLAVSAEMVFVDLPFLERVRRITDAGFEVEIWDWTRKAVEQLDCPRLNVHGTGLDPQGLPVLPTEVVTPAMWLQAVKTLSRLAELGERAGRVFTLENLNTAVDHPGTPFAKAADTLALVEAVDSPHLALNLDLYHAQIGEGNLVQLVERALGS